MLRGEFREFLLKENQDQEYLGHQVGDILSAIQSLVDDSQHLGSRRVVKASLGIVNQIRRILHDNWPDEDRKTLLALQKVGVAVMKGIDENDDLRQILASSLQYLQKIAGDLGEPLNEL